MNGSQVKKRIGSRRIIPSSGLPETFHHSIQTAWYWIQRGYTPTEALQKYYDRKVKKKDQEMLEYLGQYWRQTLAYLEMRLEQDERVVQGISLDNLSLFDSPKNHRPSKKIEATFQNIKTKGVDK